MQMVKESRGGHSLYQTKQISKNKTEQKQKLVTRDKGGH